MQITIDRTLFDPQTDEESQCLLDLLLTAVRDRYDHAIITDPIYQHGQPNGEIDQWLAARPAREAVAFRTLLAKGLVVAAGTRTPPVGETASAPRAWNLAGTLEVRAGRRTISDWTTRELTLSDAADTMREPVHLVLENERTERAFIRHLAGPTSGTTLLQLLSAPGRIVAHGGGGGEAKKWVDDLISRPPTSSTWRRMLRAWVLFDQDADVHDALAPSASAVALMAACEQVVAQLGSGLSWICLRRRELESYAPDSWLQGHTGTKQSFAQEVIAWRRRADRLSWAWALDLKKGLHGDRHSTWSHGLSEADAAAIKQGKKPLEASMLKTPFSTLSSQEIGTLARGFGDAFGEELRLDTDPPWTADLPREYDRGPSTQVPRALFVQSLFDRM